MRYRFLAAAMAAFLFVGPAHAQVGKIICQGLPALTGAVTTTAGQCNTHLATAGNNTVLGNVSGGSAEPTMLTQAQITALLNTFTPSLAGTVPASGGGTTNFLRADGTWAAPPGGGGGIAGPGTTVSGYFPTWTSTTGASVGAGLAGPATGTLIGSVTAPASNPVTGTPSSSNFLRGDGTWATPSGSGNVSGPGSSTNLYIPQWSGTSGTSLGAGIAAPSGAIVGTTDTQTLTNKSIDAGEIASGTLPAARLPAPSATTLGGIESITSTSHQWIDSISTLGVPHQSQPAIGDISGLGTGVATALGVAVGSAGAPVVNGGALGTPSSGTLTNATGTASGLTAGTATAANGLASATTTVSVSAATAPASGQVLTATSGTAATWQTPAAGGSGALTLISTQTASNSAALQWTNLPTTYNDLELKCQGITPAANAGLNIQVGEGAGPTWETSSYTYAVLIWSSSSSVVSPQGNGGASSIQLVGNNAVNGGTAIVDANIANVASSTTYKFILAHTGFSNSGSLLMASASGEYVGDTNPVTAIRVLMSTGNITSGTCSLYGISN